MSDDTNTDDVPLSDLPPEALAALPHDHPLLDQYADEVSEKIGIPHIITALKNAGERSESTGANSTSPKGARGVMQFMPGTAKRYGLDDPTNPLASIDTAGRYVADIAKKLGTQDPGIIAAAYNAGENRPSLRRGEIPAIPETRKYVERVRQYMGGGADDVPLNDLPEGASSPLDAKNAAAGVAAASPLASDQTAGTNDLDIATPFGRINLTHNAPPALVNGMAAFGKSFSDLATGAGQLGRDAANLVTRMPLFDNQRNEVAATNARDEPLMHSGAGLAGYAAGAASTVALPGGGLGLPAKLPQLARLALMGGAYGAAAPVAGDNERAVNMGAGAALGPLAQYLGQGAMRLAAPVTSRISELASHLPGIPGILGHSLASQQTPSKLAALETAIGADVPVYSRQVRTPRYPLSEKETQGQKDALDAAISGSFGPRNADLPEAFANAHDVLSAGYDKLLNNRSIPLDFEHLADIADAMTYNSARSPRFAPNKDVDDLLKRAWDSAIQGQPINGRDYQDVMRQYKALITQLMHGTPTAPADRYSAQAVVKLMDSLENQAGKTMSPADLLQFQQLNKKWRNMAQLTPLAPKGLDDNLNTSQLARTLASKRPGEYMFGDGDQYLPNLAKYANTFMDMSTKPKPGVYNAIRRKVREAAPFMLGSGIEGVAVGSQLPDTQLPYGTALKYGAPTLALYAMNRGIHRMNNPRLTMQSLHEPTGALARLFQRASGPMGLTRALEAADADTQSPSDAR